MAARVKLYKTVHCGYCYAAKRLLAKRAADVEEIDVTDSPDVRTWLVEVSGGRRTVPVIFIDDVCVGGYAELKELDRAGELARLLAG